MRNKKMAPFYNEDDSLNKLNDEQKRKASDYMEDKCEKTESFLKEKEEYILDADDMASIDGYEHSIEYYEEKENEQINKLEYNSNCVHEVKKEFTKILNNNDVFDQEVFDSFLEDIKKDTFDNNDLEEYINDY